MRRRQRALATVALVLTLTAVACRSGARLAEQIARRSGASVEEVEAAARVVARDLDQSTDDVLRRWSDMPTGESVLTRIRANPQLQSLGERIDDVSRSSLCELTLDAISSGELPSRRDIVDSVQSNAIGAGVPAVSQVLLVDEIANFFGEVQAEGATGLQYRLFLAKLRYC